MRSRRATRARSRAAAYAFDRAHGTPWDPKAPPKRVECPGCAAGYEVREEPGKAAMHVVSGGNAGVCYARLGKDKA